jgi:hypothetical protein
VQPSADRVIDFGDVERLLRRSWTFRVVDGVVRTVATAVEHSRLIRRIRAIRLGPSARDERARLIATFVATAAAAEAILAGFVPAASSPAIPRLLWLFVALVACVPAVAPRVVVAAWDHWRRRRYRSTEREKPGPPAATYP